MSTNARPRVLIPCLLWLGELVTQQLMSLRATAGDTDHDIGALRLLVDDLALASVATLGADDHDIDHSLAKSFSRPRLRRTNGLRGRVTNSAGARAIRARSRRKRLFKSPAAMGARGKVRRVRHPAWARLEAMGVCLPDRRHMP